jgi:hypothetical protein
VSGHFKQEQILTTRNFRPENARKKTGADTRNIAAKVECQRNSGALPKAYPELPEHARHVRRTRNGNIDISSTGFGIPTT